ncbi:MAG: hypothetical protein ACXAD7_00585 [Candidatus Kariarchaeaceae archaeon]|jgi:hypothetical protein
MGTGVMGSRGKNSTKNTSSRTNITIAVSEEDKKTIDKLKKGLKKKNITQVFNHLLEFYQTSQSKKEILELEEKSNNERIDYLEGQIRNLFEFNEILEKDRSVKINYISSLISKNTRDILEINVKLKLLTTKFDELINVENFQSVDNELLAEVRDLIEEFQFNYSDLKNNQQLRHDALDESEDLKLQLKDKKVKGNKFWFG